MSKKKDKKKSDRKNSKIELREISAEEAAAMTSALEEKPSGKKSAEANGAPLKELCRVKIIPALDGQADQKYENEAATALNAVAGDGYELLSVIPSADPKKLIAFFRFSK